MLPAYLLLLGTFPCLLMFENLSHKPKTQSHTKKVLANIRRQGKDFSGTVTPLFATKLIQPREDVGEGSGQPTKSQHTPTTASPSNIEPIPLVASSSQPHKPDETVHEEKGDSMERAATTTASFDAEQDSGNIIRTQSMTTLNEPIPQGTGSGSGPRRQDTILGDRPAQTRVLALENVKTAQDLEITSLKKRKSSTSFTKEKGKAKMIEPEKPLKKKDQIKFDEEVAKRLAEELEAELEEEERVAIQREEEANLI
ncbi:hypothetical protein Tco_1149316 [Tanacetum coccineum]